MPQYYISNDTFPTRFHDANVHGSNLDLIFCSSSIIKSSSVLRDSFSSDHFPALLQADISPSYSMTPSIRFCTKNVDWPKYQEFMEQQTLEISTQLAFGLPSPSEVYDSFINLIKLGLLENSAYVPTRNSRNATSKQLWWNDKCDTLLTNRRDNYRWYQANQSASNGT